MRSFFPRPPGLILPTRVPGHRLLPVALVLLGLPPYYPRDPLLLKDWAEYLGCLRYCDKLVGQILQRLEHEGILEQTIVVLLGDNGISHACGKQFLYDEGIRTPFIVRGPGVARGAVRPDLIEHIDLAVTSLAFAGLDVPGWMQDRDVFSRSYHPRDAVFSARDRCGETVDQIRSVRTERYKYIRNFFPPERPLLQPSNDKDSKEIIQRLRALHAAGSLSELQARILFAPQRASEELYDVQADPFETRNLAADPQHLATLLALRARLERWQRDTRDPGPESPEVCRREMAYQISKTRGGPERESVERNVVLMRAWVGERPCGRDVPNEASPQTTGPRTTGLHGNLTCSQRDWAFRLAWGGQAGAASADETTPALSPFLATRLRPENRVGWPVAAACRAGLIFARSRLSLHPQP